MEFRWRDDDVESNEIEDCLRCRMSLTITRAELARLEENEDKIIAQLDNQLGNLRTALMNAIWRLKEK